MSDNYILTAYDDPRYDWHKHFLKQDINSSFLKQHNVNLTIKEFKKLLKSMPYAFKAKYGNLKTGKYGFAKFYNIHTIKKYLESQQALN